MPLFPVHLYYIVQTDIYPYYVSHTCMFCVMLFKMISALFILCLSHMYFSVCLTHEKISALYDQKSKELKLLYNRGDEANKFEACQIYIRKLAMEISVALKLVKSVSNNINKLRDEELCPQTHELIQGYVLSYYFHIRNYNDFRLVCICIFDIILSGPLQFCRIP
jgi:hypothetical protein